jgi:colanic acid/amylovoran biosynthesis protein
MRIVIVNSYDRDNKGDAALLSVLITQLRAAFGDVELTIAGGEDPVTRPEFEGVGNLGSIRRWVDVESVSRARRISRKMVAFAIALLWFRLPRRACAPLQRLLPREARDELDAVAGADLVAASGGGAISGLANLSGDLNVFFLLLPLLLAQRAGIRTFLAPQSYGPFRTTLQRTLARCVLSRADMVLVREDVSLRELQAIHVSGSRVRRAVDSAFAFRSEEGVDWRSHLGVAKAEELVGITARRWLDAGAQDIFETAMAGFIDSLATRPRSRVVLIPQVTCEYQSDDDRLVHRRIAERCREKPVLLMDKLSHDEIKGLYSSLDYLAGTRFHSVIFALMGGVPCLAIEAEHKTRGIMRDLGLDSWTIRIEDVSEERLVHLFAQLEANREDYLAQLHNVLPAYSARADEVVDVLRSVCPHESAPCRLGESRWLSTE